MSDSLFDQIRSRGEAFFTEVSNNLMANPRFIELLKKGIEAKEAIDKQVVQALKSMNVATRKDLKSLEYRIAALEADLASAREKVKAKAKTAPRKKPATRKRK